MPVSGYALDLLLSLCLDGREAKAAPLFGGSSRCGHTPWWVSQTLAPLLDLVQLQRGNSALCFDNVGAAPERCSFIPKTGKQLS